jgi:2-polyprenyl-3-methyl-5-hydroxy-6-metoxy-1,4-benzoquinol methylase
MSKVQDLLDFGCGKLRYADLVTNIGERVLLVDSRIQLTRQQRIRGRKVSVAQIAKQLYRNVSVRPAEDLAKVRNKFDVVTCINVLSAIPDLSVLRAVLQAIRRLTRRKGLAVFINQHRNSYFDNFKHGRRHLFGHIHEGRNGHSYYGVMSKDRVQRLLRTAGFSIYRSWNDGEINFVEAYPSVRASPSVVGRRVKD